MFAFVFFYLIIVNVTSCIHDQIIAGRQLTPISDHQQVGRLLQQGKLGGLRIHYEYNTTDINATDALGRNIIKIMNIISLFWQKTIQVKQRSSLSFNINQAFDKDNFQCLDFKVSRKMLEALYPNKDFGILVQAKNDGDNGVTAYSFPCAYSQPQKKPTWGIVHWNKNYVKFDPISFQQNLLIAVHEIIHLLGFSSLLFPFFKVNPVNKVGDVTYLLGSSLKKELIRQYGCQEPIGMPLQAGGGMGTALSHWSRKVASNELMTAGVSASNPTLSYITLSVLEETGWYEKIYKHYGKFINYGYQKGCDFMKVDDCSAEQYCNVKSQLQCDYDQVSLGYCKNDTLSACMYVKYYANFICIDPNYEVKGLHSNVTKFTGERGGQNSRCFVSDLIKKGNDKTKYAFRCYQTKCSPTSKTLSVRIGDSFGLCMFPNQKIKISGYDGQLRCPRSFIRTCSVRRCPKQCNANGVCLNGKCLCEKDYTGESCSERSAAGIATKAIKLVASDNENCPLGTYLNRFGFCLPCTIRCLKCNKVQCLLCMDETIPLDGQCPPTIAQFYQTIHQNDFK